jgi:hypothetical protein
LQKALAKCRIPKHLALAFGKSVAERKVMDRIIAWCSSIDGIDIITVFPLDAARVSDPRVRVYQHSDVGSTLQYCVENPSVPLPSKPDLLFVWCKDSSLAGFFPWVLDTTTFHLAGGHAGTGEWDLVEGFRRFSTAEQRFGR